MSSGPNKKKCENVCKSDEKKNTDNDEKKSSRKNDQIKCDKKKVKKDNDKTLERKEKKDNNIPSLIEESFDVYKRKPSKQYDTKTKTYVLNRINIKKRALLKKNPALSEEELELQAKELVDEELQRNRDLQREKSREKRDKMKKVKNLVTTFYKSSIMTKEEFFREFVKLL